MNEHLQKLFQAWMLATSAAQMVAARTAFIAAALILDPELKIELDRRARA